MKAADPASTGKTLPPHEVAARWVLKSEAAALSATDERALSAWLESDPANLHAWLDAQAALSSLDQASADDEIVEMRRAALAVRPAPKQIGLTRSLALVFAVLALAAGVGAYRLISFKTDTPPLFQQAPKAGPDQPTYRTGVGERSVISLSDGSVVTLDTNSLLKVAFTPEERGVVLIRGQALFEIAKHKARPFQVYVADRRITAVGTKFNVRLDDAKHEKAAVSVSLLEGVVRVSGRQSTGRIDQPAETITLAAGETLKVEPGSIMQVTRADAERIASWQAGVLTFDDARLEDAINEMNRYTPHPITLVGPDLATRRISGVFRSGDPEHSARNIADVLHLRVDHRSDGAPVLKSRD